MTWTTDTSGPINYRTAFLESDCLLLEKPLHSEILQLIPSSACYRLAFRVPMAASEEDWRDEPGRHWGSSAGMWAQAARQRIRPESSSVLQLFSRTFYLHLLEMARQEKPAAGCGGGGERLERRCHVVSNDFPSKGLKLSLIWYFCRRQWEKRRSPSWTSSDASRKRTTVSTNGRGRDGFTPEAVSFAPPSSSICKNSFTLTSNSYFHLPLHLRCCFFFSKCLFQMLVCIHTVQHYSQPWLCLNVLNNINKQDSVDQHL